MDKLLKVDHSIWLSINVNISFFSISFSLLTVKFLLNEVTPIITNIQQEDANAIKIEWSVENRQVFNLTKFQLKISPDFDDQNGGWPGLFSWAVII